MCGIYGYFDREGRGLGADQLAAMSQSLDHRGPDAKGLFASDGAAIGNCRLSIIDVAGGNQPFFSDDRQIIVVQNGEIFNHLELAAELAGTPQACRTRCDTEVLLRLYEREGLSFVSRLNGMFAIAILDLRHRALHLIRDRIGVKPLYLHDDGIRLTFASEIKALLRAGIPRRPDTEAVHAYLAFNYVPPPLTAFAGVRHLLPGRTLSITPAGRSENRWWRLSTQAATEQSGASFTEEFISTLGDAVRLRLRSDVPFGAFLSGGVDSSTIVALMTRHMPDPPRTFCIGFDDPRFDESPFAEEAARRFQTRHCAERVKIDMFDQWPRALYHCDQPHGDISFLPTLRVSELAARELKVVLTGDGGDELFAGYDKYRDFFAQADARAPDEVFQRSYFDSISLFTSRALQDLYTPAHAALTRDMDPFAHAAGHFAEVPHFDRINQALYLDMSLLLPGNNLVKPDRMGMAVSLEARTPFLDYRVMELAFRLPGAQKLQQGETKYAYKQAVAPLIGEALTYRKKQMFTVPVGEWFRGRLAPFCRRFLLEPRTTGRGIFQPAQVEKMLGEHEAGSRNHTREIRALVALEIWFRVFIDAAGEAPAPDFLARYLHD